MVTVTVGCRHGGLAALRNPAQTFHTALFLLLLSLPTPVLHDKQTANRPGRDLWAIDHWTSRWLGRGRGRDELRRILFVKAMC